MSIHVSIHWQIQDTVINSVHHVCTGDIGMVLARYVALQLFVTAIYFTGDLMHGVHALN